MTPSFDPTAWQVQELAMESHADRHRVFIIADDEAIQAVAEVSKPHDGPAELEMIYVPPELRRSRGLAGGLLTELKRLFPGLCHTGDLSPHGKALVEKHGLLRRTRRIFKRDPDGLRRHEVLDRELTEMQAEEIGAALLAEAEATRSGGAAP